MLFCLLKIMSLPPKVSENCKNNGTADSLLENFAENSHRRLYVNGIRSLYWAKMVACRDGWVIVK